MVPSEEVFDYPGKLKRWIISCSNSINYKLDSNIQRAKYHFNIIKRELRDTHYSVCMVQKNS